MRQVAPDPEHLRVLVETLRYKPGWRFTLADVDRGQGSEGLTLCVHITTPDSYNQEQMRGVMHYFIVPAAAYDLRSWRRWLFDQIVLIERHEAMEFYRFEYETPNQVGIEVLGTSHHVERPYAPSHGPGNDPYMVREVGTEADVRTSYRGVLNE